MREHVTDLRLVRIIDGAGHWVQQERPAEVNAALLEFLGGFA
jgi:pimeloyl-ACP methyl ester carboxylesterase